MDSDKQFYDPGVLEIAKGRGWDREAHQQALLAKDEDAITITHPINWLTEFEVTVIETVVLMETQGLIEVQSTPTP